MRLESITRATAKRKLLWECDRMPSTGAAKPAGSPATVSIMSWSPDADGKPTHKRTLPTTATGPESPYAAEVWGECVRSNNPCPPFMALERLMEREGCDRPRAMELLFDAAAWWFATHRARLLYYPVAEPFRHEIGGFGVSGDSVRALYQMDLAGTQPALDWWKGKGYLRAFYEMRDLLAQAVGILRELESIP